MPFLDKQIKVLNQVLKAALLTDERFAGGILYGLTSSTIKTDKDGSERAFPYFINENGEPVDVIIDDTYPVMIYHKRAADSTLSVSESSFGDSQELTEEQQMSMVVYGKGSRLRVSDEQMKSFIILAMPTEISRNLLSGIQIDKISITPTGAKMDSISVFNEEYQGSDYRLDQSDFLIKINYTLSSDFRRECIDICDC
jgi:hypothetical protein